MDPCPTGAPTRTTRAATSTRRFGGSIWQDVLMGPGMVYKLRLDSWFSCLVTVSVRARMSEQSRCGFLSESIPMKGFQSAGTTALILRFALTGAIAMESLSSSKQVEFPGICWRNVAVGEVVYIDISIFQLYFLFICSSGWFEVENLLPQHGTASGYRSTISDPSLVRSAAGGT